LALSAASSARFCALWSFSLAQSLASSAFSPIRLPTFFAVSETAFPASVSLPLTVSATIRLLYVEFRILSAGFICPAAFMGEKRSNHRAGPKDEERSYRRCFAKTEALGPMRPCALHSCGGNRPAVLIRRIG